jgi:hypothetical protein
MTEENNNIEASGGQTTSVHGQPEFILRTFNRKYVQVEKIRAWFKEIQREIRPKFGGPFRHMEGTGRFNKSIIELFGRNYEENVRNSADLKDKFRRIREQEAVDLRATDDLIRDAEIRLQRLRGEREELVKVAFQKGHVVYLNEVRDVAEANLAARKTRYQVAKEEA